MVTIMMTGVEYVREECKKRRISIAQLERDLGFSNGYFNPKKLHKIPYDRAKMIAGYLGIDINQVLGNTEADEELQQQEYYTDPETAKAAYEMATNPELRALFDVQRDMDPEDLQALYGMALALKRKSERLDVDDDPA